MRQIFVKFALRPSVVPSEIVTSLTKAAASHSMTGAASGMAVTSEKVGKGLVPVTNGVALATCETDACTVNAAAVYN